MRKDRTAKESSIAIENCCNDIDEASKELRDALRKEQDIKADPRVKEIKKKIDAIRLKYCKKYSLPEDLIKDIKYQNAKKIQARHDIGQVRRVDKPKEQPWVRGNGLL